ncbi:MAG: hypothetical protein JXA69_15090 [Phycisphaerae bacterium]|nr:hypothetical protein [Phycisphaerae bacterium]
MLYVPLTVAVVGLLAYWWRCDRDRVAWFQRCAQERNLRFSRHDLLDVPWRYGHCALLRIGHSIRVSNMVCGSHEAGLWVGFHQDCDVGLGAGRVGLRRCVALLETPNNVEAVCVPADATFRRAMPVDVSLGSLSFRSVTTQDEHTHALYARRHSAAQAARMGRLLEAVKGYPADWTWEVRTDVILAASLAAPREEKLAMLLDAVADVSRRLHAEPAPKERL